MYGTKISVHRETSRDEGHVLELDIRRSVQTCLLAVLDSERKRQRWFRFEQAVTYDLCSGIRFGIRNC